MFIDTIYKTYFKKEKNSWINFFSIFNGFIAGFIHIRLMC